MGFYVSEANLPVVIEALNTVHSPLTVLPSNRRSIERIVYDKKEQILRIVEKKGTIPSSTEVLFKDAEAIPIDGWSFIPGRGFYTEEPHELLRRPLLQGIDIPHTLSEHARLISSLIVDCQVHRDSIPLSYALHFDSEWSLHIQAYLFEPGDLAEGDSWLMENWAYLNDDGFYPVEGNRFDSVEMIVTLTQVSDFVAQNRAWFNTQEGYHTHVRSIEYQLSYHVGENNRLSFMRSLVKAKESGVRMQDFGVWVYLEGYGFYSKAAGAFNYLLKPGISLSPEQVPLFIRMNREELQVIPKFFSETCPVAKTGIKLEWNEKKKIQIAPEYELHPSYRGKELRIFDDYIYLEGEGFHELPFELRLPDKFRHPIELEGDDLILFLSYEIDSMTKYVTHMDRRLVKPKKLRLIANFIERVPEKGRGWYRLSLYYETERGLIPVANLRQLLGKKFPFAALEEGLMDLREKRFDWLRQLDKDRFERKGNTVLLTALEFMRLNAFEPIGFCEAGEGSHESAEIFDRSHKIAYA